MIAGEREPLDIDLDTHQLPVEWHRRDSRNRPIKAALINNGSKLGEERV